MSGSNNHFSKLFSFFFLFLCVTSCTHSPTQKMASLETKEKYHAADIEEYLESLTDKGSPGFSYLISKDGLIISKGGFGLADIENKTLNNTKTIFRAASLTKQFTAVVILQLVAQGKLSLDDKLEKFFPELPNASKISISNLLTHTSGIWDQEKDEDFPFPIENEVTTYPHLTYIQKYKPYFEPGEQWRYSNNGYFILGLIIEKVSHTSLEDYMQKNIFDPLGMKNSGLAGNTTGYKNSAKGYGILDGKPYREKDTNMYTYKGAAALYTSVDDLLIWNEALHNGKLLSKESYKKMISPYQFTNGFVPFVGYGFGLGIEDIAGHKTIGHLGRLYGFHADILRLPNDNITYIFLANVNISQLKSRDRVAQKIIEILYKN